uniref:hypothetical protein n=1 Tax=Xanthomonas sacchari TaxID=56458 RepID=UPI001F1C8813
MATLHGDDASRLNASRRTLEPVRIATVTPPLSDGDVHPMQSRPSFWPWILVAVLVAAAAAWL